MDEVSYNAGSGETFVSNDVSRRDEAVPDKSSTRDYTQFDFIVYMLCNSKVGSGEQDTETEICEIRRHLHAQETELKLQTKALDTRALSARDLRKKVDESDNLSHEKKCSLFHMLSKYRAQFTSKPGLCKISEYESEVQCSEPVVGITYTTNNISSHARCTQRKRKKKKCSPFHHAGFRGACTRQSCLTFRHRASSI